MRYGQWYSFYDDARLAVVGLVGQHAPQGEDGEEGGGGQRAAAGRHQPQHVWRLLRAQISSQVLSSLGKGLGAPQIGMAWLVAYELKPRAGPWKFNKAMK